MKTLNSIQKEVMCGTLLGDGGLYNYGKTSGTNAHFITNHQALDKDYVFWLYSIFKNLCSTKPTYLTWFDNRPDHNRWYEQYRLRTGALPVLTSIQKRWYVDKTKILPLDFKQSELTDMCLAVWFLDDGTAYYTKKIP